MLLACGGQVLSLSSKRLCPLSMQLDLRPAVQQVLFPYVPRSASHESYAVLYLRPRAQVHHLKWELTNGNVVLVTLPLYERTLQSDEWFVGRTSMRACVD